MNYANIKHYTIENGFGVRVSLFVSGCHFHCPGCFNEAAWNFNYGKQFGKDAEDEVIEAMRPQYMAGLTLLGGEPAIPMHQEALLPLLRRIRTELPGKTVWLYTGYVFEDFAIGGDAYLAGVTDEFLSLIDVMVDGRFEESKKDISLKFRGSSNQRVIMVPQSLEEGHPVLLPLS